MVAYVDDKASKAQEEALLAVWSGKKGGPVADLAQLIGEVVGVERAIGAICVFGPRLGRKKKPEPFCAEATARIIEEMKKLGLQRLIVQTGAMAGGDSPNWSWFVRRFVSSYRKNYPEINKDRDAQELVTRESARLDYYQDLPNLWTKGHSKGKSAG